MDRFKVINESLGRTSADELLLGAAARMGQIVGRNDTLARLGGDRFAILIDDMDADRALEVATARARAIQHAVSVPVLVGRHEVFASVSVGIVTGTSDYSCAEEVVRDAEVAMRRARQVGLSGWAVFDASMDRRHAAALELEMDLRRAIERSEFELVYQPIVSARTGRFAAYEALIRWRHPRRGLLEPGAFIGLLYDTGLIVSAGRWVFEETCRQSKSWQEEHGRIIPVSMNLSAPEFGAPGLVSAIGDALRRTGADPAGITIEITEGALMGHSDGGEDTLSALRDRGLRLLIDDFGTGYSSLSYLGRLPVRGLKIPRELVSRIDEHPEDRAIVRAIAALSSVLGLDVVAEGVENREQLAQLRKMECHHIQGYLISPPLQATDANRLLKSPADYASITAA
jgi:diguanylate cyclase (GGDEF)-like protein